MAKQIHIYPQTLHDKRYKLNTATFNLEFPEIKKSFFLILYFAKDRTCEFTLHFRSEKEFELIEAIKAIKSRYLNPEKIDNQLVCVNFKSPDIKLNENEEVIFIINSMVIDPIVNSYKINIEGLLVVQNIIQTK